MFWWQNFNPQPIAFQIGDWPVYYYGLVLALAFLAGYLLAEHRARHLCHFERNEAQRVLSEVEGSVNLADNDFLQMFWVVFLSGAVGARIWDWFFYENFQTLPWWEIFNIHGGGLAIHGFILGGMLGLIIWVLLSRNPHQPSPLKRGRIKEGVIQNFIITLLPAFLLAQAVGRWGNFFNQELYGAPTNLPWGIFISPEKRMPGYESFQYFQPVFLYESLWLFLGLWLFLWLERKQPPPALPLEKGEDKGGGKFSIQNSAFRIPQKILLPFFLFWIFCGRALMELIRLDPAPLWFGLRAPLVYSAIIAIISLVYLLSVLFSSSSRMRGSTETK